MWNKAALVTLALAFALPLFADNPSNSTHKNTRTVAPKTAAPKSYTSTALHNRFSDPTVVNSQSGGIGGDKWSTGSSTSSNSKAPVVRKRNTGSGSISSAANALGPSN
jgi:hypothetical protein